MKLDERQGALVSEVVPGSPAAQTGIRPGDVIVALNDEPIQEAHDLPALVARTPRGRARDRDTASRWEGPDSAGDDWQTAGGASHER